MKKYKAFKKIADSKLRKLRNMSKTNRVNDGSRTLNESIIANEVIKALTDWINNNSSNGVLIGGIALSFYVKPRYTTDIDFLYLTDSDIPEKVSLFKRHRKGAFQHNKTHVEIEVVTPKSIDIPTEVAKQIIDNSNVVNNVRIATPSGLVASKLFRFSLQDKADIGFLIEYGGIDLTNFGLSQKELDKFEMLKKEI